MQSEKCEIKVLNPRGVISDDGSVNAAEGFNTLSGKRIGILNNSKTGGEELLDFLEEGIRNRVGNIEFKRWKIPFMLAEDEKRPRLRELAAYSDGAIALMGD